MITEDYVSYEVAKLLKDKGFDEICTLAYEELNQLKVMMNWRVASGYLPCPTHQMAMKWLREKHNLFIWISLRRPNMGLPYCYELHSISTGEVIHIGGFNFGSYEQAVEAALKYCLTELL